MTAPNIAMFGANGFIGSHTASALESHGANVLRIATPRLPPISAANAGAYAQAATSERRELAEKLKDCAAVINAAGIPDASAPDEALLIAANATWPALAALAAHEAGVKRYIHVSSTVVQGDMPTLSDSAETKPFSPYSRSKALGESLVLSLGTREAIVYRPPSVHSSVRRITRGIHAFARLPISCTASPGTSNSPQALIQNIADAIAFLALVDMPPPAIVSHPSEGITTRGLLTLLGGREPFLLPAWLAQSALSAIRTAAHVVPSIRPNLRRLELLWFGQAQARSWLTNAGWQAPVGREGWHELRRELDNR